MVISIFSYTCTNGQSIDRKAMNRTDEGATKNINCKRIPKWHGTKVCKRTKITIFKLINGFRSDWFWFWLWLCLWLWIAVFGSIFRIVRSFSMSIFSIALRFCFYLVLFSIIRIHLEYIGIQCPLSDRERKKEKEIDWKKKRKFNFFHFVQMLKKMKSDKLNGRVLEAWWVMGRIYAPEYIHNIHIPTQYTMIKNERTCKFVQGSTENYVFDNITLFRPRFLIIFWGFSIFSGATFGCSLLDGGVTFEWQYTSCERNRL